MKPSALVGAQKPEASLLPIVLFVSGARRPAERPARTARLERVHAAHTWNTSLENSTGDGP